MQSYLTSLLASANTSAVVEQMANNLTMRGILNEPGPALNMVQNIVTQWLRIDLTTMAAVITLFGSLTSILSVLQGAGSRIYWWIIKFLTASVSVHGSDCLNREIIAWISSNVLHQKGTRMLTAGTETVTDMGDWRDYVGKQNREQQGLQFETRVPIRYYPTFGLTFFLFENRPFMVRRIPLSGSLRGSLSNEPDEYAAAPRGEEPLVVLCLGRSVTPIKRFFGACRAYADQSRASFVRVRTSGSSYHSRDSWDTTIFRPLRPLETVHFDEAVKAELVADVVNYLDPATRQFYTERGIPYRRGYLLHGPPGTGKTSLALALATEFKLDLYIVHIPSIREDSILGQLFAILPHRCIVLLEDIDAVGITQRKSLRMRAQDDPESDSDDDDSDSDDEDDDTRRSYGRSECTLSGLLNVLDGVASQEGRIVLLTSNVPEKLDRALIRPGRVDRMVYLGNISQRSAELMFLRMYADTAMPTSTQGAVGSNEKSSVEAADLPQLAASFARQIPPDTFTPAHLQGFLLGHRSSATKAVASCAAWVAEETAIMQEMSRRSEKLRKRRERKRQQKKMAKRLAKALATKTVAEDSVDKDGTDEQTSKVVESGDKNADATKTNVS